MKYECEVATGTFFALIIFSSSQRLNIASFFHSMTFFKSFLPLLLFYGFLLPHWSVWSLWLSVCLSVCLFRLCVCVLRFLSVHMCFTLSVCMTVWLSVCLSCCLPVSLNYPFFSPTSLNIKTFSPYFITKFKSTKYVPTATVECSQTKFLDER